MFQSTGKKKKLVSVSSSWHHPVGPLSPAHQFRHGGNASRGPSCGSAEGAAGAAVSGGGQTVSQSWPQVGGSRSLARDGRPMAAVSTNTFYSAVATDTAPGPQGATWTKWNWWTRWQFQKCLCDHYLLWRPRWSASAWTLSGHFTGVHRNINLF